jgi:hypothetical protein
VKTFVFIVVALLLLGNGCQHANFRIQEHAAEFAALPPATQQHIRHGLVEPGYTADMVYMALGRPAETATDAAGQTIWLYHEYPVTAYNETIQSGYRRRVVYDPVKRTEDVIIEPIDTKAFPNLVPHTLRVTFRNGTVAAVERLPARG